MFIIRKTNKSWDFPGGPVVKNLHFHCRGKKKRKEKQTKADEVGGEGEARGKRYGDICICITDSLCYKAETNTPL